MRCSCLKSGRVADAADAARFGFRGGRPIGHDRGLPGLCGSEAALTSVPEANRLRAKLVGAAIALGVGKAAVAHAIASMKKRDVKPGPDTTVPHWTLADGATDVQAARLLTYSAAQSLDHGGQAADLIARALEFASNAATRAVDAAIRVEGVTGFTKGGLLERLSQDARTLQVILR